MKSILRKSQSGQASVEAVLIMVLFVAVAMWLSQQFKSRSVVANLVEGPWAYIDGMAQHGVWGESRRVIQSNPYSTRRVSSKSVTE